MSMDGRLVGVVGLGVVGGTVAQAFREAGVQTRGYDRYLDIGRPADLAGCSVVFVCVPTPGAPDGKHDVTEVWTAVKEIEPHLDPGSVVAIKSTVPPGTCDLLGTEFPRIEFASVPEFLVAARAMETLTRPDRVVIGARSRIAAETLAGVMAAVAPAAPIIFLLPTEAELVKLCSNAMLAAKVVVANELAEVCSRFGVAWTPVQAAVGLDRRIGPDHLTVTPERGFGGACLPKDLDGLIGASESAGCGAPVLRAIADLNRSIRRVEEADQAPTAVAHS